MGEAAQMGAEAPEVREPEELTAKEERALEALLERPTQAEAAAAVGITIKTLRRWLRKPRFLAAYQRARREVMGAVTAKLQATCGQAVDTLKAVMGDGEAPPAAKVGAARAVLDHAQRALELEDLGARLERLEERALQITRGRA